MNPSASGWINKYAQLTKNTLSSTITFASVYANAKDTGFVYGINIKISDFIDTEHDLSDDEKAKINLLSALYSTYLAETTTPDYSIFLKKALQFYKDLKIDHISFFDKILVGNDTSGQLEILLSSRIYIEDNVISKTFNSVITNSLLFIDVLAFKRYLKQETNIRTYAQELEYIAINITYHALNSKESSKKDDKLAELFASSLTYIDSEKQNFDGSYRNKLLENYSIWENKYFLDIACLTVWEDQSLEYKESEFIFGIGKDLNFNTAQINQSLKEITLFFDENAANIPFLKDQNLALQFYDSMSKIVNKLILRNSKRLQKEISESAELVSLLSKSTVKDLSTEEKKKVQNQLIDIFKSVPSLAIFMLPGGAVLLPIFIKLIPKLLPSSFDENRVEESPEND